MSRKINPYLFTFLSLLLGMFSSEIIFRLINESSLLSLALLRIFSELTIISAILTFILVNLKKKVRGLLTLFFILLSNIYACLQLGFNNFLGVYISFQTSSQLGAVKDYIADFIRSFRLYYFLTIIPFIIILIIYIIINKRITDNINKKTNIRASLTIFLVSLSIFIASIITPFMQDKNQTISNRALFKNASNPSLTIEQYGTLGFCFLDIKALIFPVEVEEVYEVTNKKEKTLNEYTREIDDTLWQEVIDTETNKTLNSLNNYFINRDITDKNEYTGLFEGKNLIVIMMESVNDIFINEEFYPNFYKLVNEGWYWKNNYSPRNSCATMNNEFSGMTSLYSIYNTCTASRYKSNTYYESMFNLFNNQKYITFSAHDYTQAYYPRKTIHTNMGSGEYFGAEKLGISYSSEYINWANDDDFMEAILDIIDKKTSDGENFMTWLTTVSSHQPYTVSSIQGDKYYSMTSGLNYPSDVRRYMSKLKILDEGLGILLEGLESRGILDDTVIVLYGDHYPYGISKKNLNKVMDIDVEEDNNAERVPFIIYNSEQTPQVYEEYTSYINILPTLANLFNLDYDPRLYLGTDLLSEDYSSLVVFADGSWKNEVAFYNASKNKIKYYGDTEYTSEEINSINKDINTKISVSSSVIKNNYFSYLAKKLGIETTVSTKTIATTKKATKKTTTVSSEETTTTTSSTTTTSIETTTEATTTTTTTTTTNIEVEN